MDWVRNSSNNNWKNISTGMILYDRRKNQELSNLDNIVKGEDDVNINHSNVIPKKKVTLILNWYDNANTVIIL